MESVATWPRTLSSAAEDLAASFKFSALEPFEPRHFAANARRRDASHRVPSRRQPRDFLCASRNVLRASQPDRRPRRLRLTVTAVRVDGSKAGSHCEYLYSMIEALGDWTGFGFAVREAYPASGLHVSSELVVVTADIRPR